MVARAEAPRYAQEASESPALSGVCMHHRLLCRAYARTTDDNHLSMKGGDMQRLRFRALPVPASLPLREHLTQNRSWMKRSGEVPGRELCLSGLDVEVSPGSARPRMKPLDGTSGRRDHDVDAKAFMTNPSTDAKGVTISAAD